MKRILCVDDEELILKALEQILRSNGYAPRCVTNGKEALEIVQQDHVDVFFLDLRMPTMDGMELCRRIKQLRPSAHVFALSAYVGAYSEEELCDAGFNACFSKPFKLDELLEVCTRAFGEQE